MANEQTSVPLYAASEVLTAANMNISAGTGVPVFATTVTRDAAFGGAGEKVLAEGQLCYLSSTNVVQYYDGAAWATVGPATAGALVFVKSQVIGSAVGSVTVTSAFSTTYDTYKITISGGVASTNNELRTTLGATTTGYNQQYLYGDFANISNALGTSNAASWLRSGGGVVGGINYDVTLVNPFLASNTFITSSCMNSGNAGFFSGYLTNTTSYTDFTITASTGTLTGGTVRVYGYSNS